MNETNIYYSYYTSTGADREELHVEKLAVRSIMCSETRLQDVYHGGPIIVTAVSVDVNKTDSRWRIFFLLQRLCLIASVVSETITQGNTQTNE